MATKSQISNLQKQANALQSTLNKSVKSGDIPGGKVVGGKVVSNQPSQATPQLTALSVALAKGAPVSKGVKDNNGNDVGGRVLSRPSATLAPDIKPYDGPVQYSGDSLTSPRENPAGTATGATGFETGQPTPFQYTPNTTKSDSFYQSLLGFLKPSNEENNVASQQQALDTELRNTNQGQDEMNRNIKDQPIALPFITGQQNAVEERYALARGDIGNRQQTLQAKLANLQARRQSSIDVAKTGLDYAKDQESRAEKSARQQYEDKIDQSRYNDKQTQQQYENTTNASQKQYENELDRLKLNKSTNKSTPTSSSVPKGGRDSAEGVDFINGKKAAVTAQTMKMFPSSFSTPLMSSLNDEQLRLFMNDYTETQNQSQQSIDPTTYFTQWKTAAGIGSKSSSGGRSS